MSLPTLLVAQPQTPSDFADEFNHFYYGNIYGPGQVVIASTAEARSEVESVIVAYRLGSGEKDPERWRRLPAGLTAEAVFAVGDGGAVVTTLHKWSGGDERGSFYYHWVFLSRRRTAGLRGAWDLVFRALAATEPENLREAYPRADQKTDYITLHFTAQQIQQSASEHTTSFFREFALPQDRLTAARIISLCLRGGDACVITGIETLPNRLSAALSMAALLPPPLRVFASFATGVRHVDDCAVIIKFTDANQTHGSDYVVNWSAEAKTFTGYREPPTDLHPLVQRLLQAANDSPRALQQLHDKWSERSAALMAYQNDAQQALTILMRWIELDERWDGGRDLAVFAELAALLVDDPSVEEQRRQAFWEEIITQAASDPASPYISKIGSALSEYLGSTPNSFPDTLRGTLFGAASGDNGLAAYHLAIRLLAEGYLPRSNWQAMPLELALTHIRTRRQSHDVIEALYAFEGSQWDHGADWSLLLDAGVVTVSQPGASLSQEDALVLLRLCLAHLSPAQMAALLDVQARWLSQLPQTLADALSGWPRPGANTLQALRTHFPETEADRALLAILLALHPPKDVTWLANSQTIVLLMQAGVDFSPLTDSDKVKSVSPIAASRAATAALYEMVIQGSHLEGEEVSNVRRQLLLWGLQHTSSLKDDSAVRAALSALLETLLPDEPQRLFEFFGELLRNGAPLRALFGVLLRVAPPSDGSGLERQAALLYSSEPGKWSQVPDLPRNLIQAIVSGSGQESGLSRTIGADKCIELLRWQVSQDPRLTNPLTNGLLDWWINFLKETINRGDANASAGWVGRVVGALQNANTALRFYEKGLFDALRDVQLEHLEGLLAAIADNPQMGQTQSLLKRAILLKRLLPDGSFDTFISELQGAKASLLRLQALPELDQPTEMESVLGHALAEIPRQQVEALHETLEGLSELLYQMAKDYETLDRRISGPFGLGRKVKPDLEEGKAAPKSKLGLLRWLQGIAARTMERK